MEGLKGKRELEMEECSQAAYGWQPDRPSPAIQSERESITMRAAKTCQDYSESIKCLLTTSSSRALVYWRRSRGSNGAGPAGQAQPVVGFWLLQPHMRKPRPRVRDEPGARERKPRVTRDVVGEDTPLSSQSRPRCGPNGMTQDPMCSIPG